MNKKREYLTTDEFVKRAKSVHGHENIDYSHCEYKGRHKPVDLYCNIHGHFTNIAINHLNGAGCPYCSGKYNELLVGKKIDYLTVLEVVGKTNHGVQYRCQCDCGNICVRSYRALSDTKTISSCGCKHPSRNEINIGDVFGSLTIIREVEPKYRQCGISVRRFECQCECGEIDIYNYSRLSKDAKCYKCSQLNPIIHEYIENEEWRPAKNWEDYIEISNMGRVRSVDRTVDMSNGGTRFCKGQPLNPHHDKDGYFRVSLKYQGRCKNVQVHRLVAETFLPKVDGKDCVDHINGIRDDNRLENLRWCTNLENVNFPIAHKNRRQSVINSYKNNPELRQIRARTFGRSGLKPVKAFLNGKYIGTFDSQVAFAREYKLNQSTVSVMYRKGREHKGYTIKPC